MSGDQPCTGSEVLITGMSGRFPKASSVKQFQDNLYNKVDMLEPPTKRWEFSHPEMSARLGICSDMETFDAQFFGIHYKQAASMDPTLRKLLECACEAIVDAGLNPKSLRNTNTGVYMAASISESEKNLNYDSSTISGYGLTGSSRSMMANRISFWLGAQGPSYSSDNACCGGALVLQQAYHAMANGDCDSAIVGSSNLCLEPCINMHFRWMELLTLGEKTKSFDQSADGYNRSDAMVVFLLQKPKNAKRVYAQLVHTKTIYTGMHEVDHTFQLLYPERFENFLVDFYKEAGIKPEVVEFIEACGSGVNKIDFEELQAIDKVFCPKTRKDQIKVGSVKSNMGNCEASSPLVALVKLCLAYHTGKIAGNLHLENPRSDVEGVRVGRMQLLADHELFNRGYSAVNTFSYNGVNGHILLKNYNIERKPAAKFSDLPYLICAASRNEETFPTTFTDLESKPLDQRQIALVNNVYGNEVAGLLMRGYKIYSVEEGQAKSLEESFAYYDGTQRPVWFVYSGMGSQWPTMGAHLLRFPVFAAAIERCSQILQPKGLDLIKLLTDPDPETYSNILHSFVAIAAVQIGLTDLLHSLGITPDNIIGHSVGELGCAYADGCLSAEEMILAAYYRGLVSIQTPFIKGSMAAIGLGYTTIRSVCPPEIEVACHNGQGSSTVSGPADVMTVFVGELTKRGVFAKEVACSNIAYHSKYIAAAGPGLLKYMSQVIQSPKMRSSRWISSSVPQLRWEEASAKFCSPEYLTNNLLNPVLFEEASRHIPDNAITIEIAPHGLLQAILRRSLSPNCINVSLTRRGHKDNVLHVLDAVGKLYIAGLYPKLNNLYPQVQVPVSADTPLMSHTVSWVHDEIWPVGCGRRPAPLNSGKYHYVLSTKDSDYRYLNGNFINGVNIYPAAAQLVLIWELLGMVLEVPYTKLSVRFENVRFNCDVVIPTDDPLELVVFLQQASGNFEITKQGIAVTSGRILVTKEFTQRNLENLESDDLILDSKDVYRIFALRGYNYNGEFRSIKKVSNNFSKAAIDYTDNWVTFLDSLMQFSILAKNNTSVSRPWRIESLEIDLKIFTGVVEHLKRNEYLDAIRYIKHNIIRCSGVVMKELVTEDFNLTDANEAIIQKYEFVPFNTKVTKIGEALKLHLQTIYENIPHSKLEFVELLNEETDKSIKSVLDTVVRKLYSSNVEINLISHQKDEVDIPVITRNAHIIITYNLSKLEQIQKRLSSHMGQNSFILNIEDVTTNKIWNDFQSVSSILTPGNNVILLKKPPIHVPVIKVADEKIVNWLQNKMNDLSVDEEYLLLVSKIKYELIEKINILRKYQNGHIIKLLMIDDNLTPSFDLKLQVYGEQVKKGLAVNILTNGVWGSQRYFNLEETHESAENAQLMITKPGDFDSLTWIDTPPPRESNKILVKVHYVRITCSDLIKVKRQKQMCDDDLTDRTLGMSFSGITKGGDRVMGLVQNNIISSVIEADPELLWPVPEYWTLKEAASVPRAYVHALYCLLTKTTDLARNSSVLVTSGAGALGQAVISICLGTGRKVFATVANQSKKALLLRMFPGLNENNVCTCEDTALMHMISEGTEDQGCGLIISSTKGSNKLVVMNCLAQFSHFVDIDFTDLERNADFGMSFLRDDRAYLAANFACIFAPNESPLRKTLRKAMYEGIQAGWVKPLSHVVFDSQHVQRAFRFLASRRNHGAVLLKLRNASSTSIDFKAMSSWRCDDKGVQLVVCDKDALGIEVADRLIQLGAKNLVINSPDINGYAQYKVKCWASNDVNVQLTSEDLSCFDNASALLSHTSKLGTLSSIFVIRAASEHVFRNLHLASKQLQNLTKFVMIKLSDILQLNNVEEAICAERLTDDAPAMAVHCLPQLQDINQPKQQEELVVSLSLAARYLSLVVARQDSSIIVFPASRKPRNLIDILCEAVGVSRFDKLDDSLTIQDLGIDEKYLVEVSNTLVDVYHLPYDVSEILPLTMKDIKDLHDDKKIKKASQASGFSMFFRHYDHENLFVSEPLAWMPTVIVDGENRVDFYKGEDYLIIVPGMDGHRHAMYRLCRRLRLRAIVCQYPVELKPNSVQELAQHFVQKIKAKIGIGSKFYVMGYSFGALVALEMAWLFEKSGMEGKVFCLDGSPLAMSCILKSQIEYMSEDQKQNNLLSHLYTLMSNQQTDNILSKLEKAKTWDEKVQLCLRKLKTFAEEPFEFQSLVLQSAYKRITQTLEYNKGNIKLSSEIVLLRANNALYLPKEYGLEELTSNTVTVYDLPSNHVTAPYDLRCSDIINRELNLDKSTVESAIARLNNLNSSLDGRMIR